MSEQSIENKAESLARQRWWAMLLFLLIWVSWIIATLKPVSAFLERKSISADAVELWGGAVLIVAFVTLGATVMRIARNRRLCGMLNDELAKANWRRSLAAGYYASVVALLVAAVALKLDFVDPQTMLVGLLTVAAAVPTAFNVWLERDAAHG